MAALRRHLDLDEVPPRVVARVFAVTRYVLSVNGQEVRRGPVRANPRAGRYDVVDLSPFLLEGPNTIGALVWSDHKPTAWTMTLPGVPSDLGAGGFVLEAELGGLGRLVTDDAWTGTVLDGWDYTDGAPPLGRGNELMDARSLPLGWNTPQVSSELGWRAAIVRTAKSLGEPGFGGPPSFPVGPRRPNTTSGPTAAPTSFTAHPDDPLSWSGDRIGIGTVVLDVEGPRDTEVELRSSERVSADGRAEPGDGDVAVRFTLDGTRRRLETLDLYGCRAVRVRAPDGVVVHGVELRELTYPCDVGWFRCSDPDLDQIWEVGRRTVTICSTDSYLDCPTREQRAWTGDSVVHQMVDLTTNGDWGLARWHPQLAASPRADGMLPMAVGGEIEQLELGVIPDWALHWIRSVHNLYRYVGDRDEVAALLPVAELVLRWLDEFRGPDGLLHDVNGWVLIDWAAVHTKGASSSLCGLWGRALLDYMEMAEWLGDAGRASWARHRHEQLRRGFEEFWDPERGRYADVIVDGGRRATASQHGQASAVVGGLVPEGRHGELVPLLLEGEHLVDAAFTVTDRALVRGGDDPVWGPYLASTQPDPWWDVDRLVVRAQPFFRYVVHDALSLAGRDDLIPTACLDWRALLARCDTSWSETWYGGTRCHGWSSTPTRDLVARTLGVEPAEPGFGVARVDPHLGPLDWAAGRVPCPAGWIEVDCRDGSLTVESPVPWVHAGARHPAGRTTVAL